MYSVSREHMISALTVSEVQTNRAATDNLALIWPDFLVWSLLSSPRPAVQAKPVAGSNSIRILAPLSLEAEYPSLSNKVHPHPTF